MEKEKNKNGLVTILVIIILVLAVLCALFATGTINFKPKEETIKYTPNIEQHDFTDGEIKARLVRLSSNGIPQNSETTYNGITVKVEEKGSEYTLFINNKDVTNEVINMYISEYEIYDNNVIIYSGSTNNGKITIFHVQNGNVETVFNKSYIDGYKLDSFKTENNKIILTSVECGEQCGDNYTENRFASFEMEYQNSKFTEPKKVNTIKSKFVDVFEDDETSETTFNKMTVKYTKEENAIKLQINDKDITSELGNINMYIKSYEFYDNYIIVFSGSTNNLGLTVFKVNDTNVEKTFQSHTINDYRIESYYSRYGRLIIKGKECGEQCGKKLTGKTYATFEMKYNNETFSNPVLAD